MGAIKTDETSQDCDVAAGDCVATGPDRAWRGRARGQTLAESVQMLAPKGGAGFAWGRHSDREGMQVANRTVPRERAPGAAVPGQPKPGPSKGPDLAVKDREVVVRPEDQRPEGTTATPAPSLREAQPGYDDLYRSKRRQGGVQGPAGGQPHVIGSQYSYPPCDDELGVLARDCIGAGHPSYDEAEKHHSDTLEVQIEQLGAKEVMIQTDRDGKRTFSLDGGGTFMSEDEFQAQAHRLLADDDSAWTPERLADLATRYGTWVAENYNIYGSFHQAFHKEDPQPHKPMDAVIMDAYGDAAQTAMGFIRPVQKAVAVFCVVLFSGGTLMYLESGIALAEIIAGPGQALMRSLIGPLGGGVEMKVDWGALGEWERGVFLRTLATPEVLERFFSTQAADTPLPIRGKVAEIAQGAR